MNAGKKVNPDMVKKFTELGVPLLQAKPGSGTLGKGHAEAAAAGLRNTNAAGQQAILGGQMADVRAAISSTRACSDECGTDMSTFVGTGQLGQYSYGWYHGMAITEPVYKSIYGAEGYEAVGQAPLHNMIHWFTSGFGISPGDEDSHGGMGAIESGGGADDEEG